MSINVYTEWGSLKEVIVGSCYNLDSYKTDISFKNFFAENIENKILENSIKLQRHLIDQRNQDLDEMAETLRREGIKVHRPGILEEPRTFKTPYFSDQLTPVDNPRDQVLIIGDQIIETPCIWRRRYFENDLLKDVFMDYFKKGAKWSSAPRPKMEDRSFDLSNVDRSKVQIDWEYYDSLEKNFEIMFDGAQCLKFGKDILMNVSNENHKLGLKWLQSHLGDKFRVHGIPLTDHHIDGMLMPLKPGLLLVNNQTMEEKRHLLPKALQKWEVVRVPLPHKSTEGEYFLASSNINVNVLPLSESKVLIFGETLEGCRDLEKKLKEYQFDVIPIRLRHSRLFGGGAHCATLDTVRDDSLEDYFS